VVATAGRRFDLHRESDVRTAGSHRGDVTEAATAEEPDNGVFVPCFLPLRSGTW
jgi:hypothetical protein